LEAAPILRGDAFVSGSKALACESRGAEVRIRVITSPVEGFLVHPNVLISRRATPEK